MPDNSLGWFNSIVYQNLVTLKRHGLNHSEAPKSLFEHHIYFHCVFFCCCKDWRDFCFRIISQLFEAVFSSILLIISSFPYLLHVQLFNSPMRSIVYEKRPILIQYTYIAIARGTFTILYSVKRYYIIGEWLSDIVWL